ncbi:MAG: bifunctional hydroxymethylpyrimidine kinase/phosphomethylpyrimidine kinase [Deltaproteobacteria bacterium CG_4_9_14_3_um_filter_63_12]|nr:MAG: bifunctional hydroxymethylpyrimidine kinase/phosphomethylpyrimidine kinase [Deltaproteobacteria bacterium CG17_big_fil_post_rev_8_21_14_2_50_63_7]PJB34117.1 MAG: bifunctional hydroxymethylpyrimidine kinase/phosphomethylpyrimidine kinase [Deltaproteobacteria bacterium CG_4_9_14_3_um_filter_63_12]
MPSDECPREAPQGVFAPPVVALYGGTDPSGGAGLPADLRVCGDFHCWGWPVTNAVIAQNSRTVRHVHPVPAESLRAQWQSMLGEVRPVVLKIGLLGSPAAVDVALEFLPSLRATGARVVCDPILSSGLGDALSVGDLERALSKLLPCVDVLTPNLPEAVRLVGAKPLGTDELRGLAEALLRLGPQAVVLKGGHLPGAPGDLLASAGMTRFYPNEERFDEDVHGTGCHLASAIACGLALGHSLEDALEEAKRYLARLMRAGRCASPRGRSILLPFRGE